MEISQWKNYNFDSLNKNITAMKIKNKNKLNNINKK